jgi:hypothetical protein
LQDKYKGLSDRAIRNKTNPTKPEQELTDTQANAVADEFLEKMEAEPVFGKHVLRKIVEKLEKLPRTKEEYEPRDTHEPINYLSTHDPYRLI